MAIAAIREIETRSQAAWKHLTAQLAGLAPYLERSDEPGEWTAREVLTHLLFPPGADMVELLKSFAERDLPLVELEAGDPFLTPERRAMTLEQLVAALDGQRRAVFAYLGSLSEADLTRKARIPLFKTFMGTDEITLPVFAGAMYEYHWNDHAAQLAKIRDAVGLPAAG
jgi:DinB family protein